MIDQTIDPKLKRAQSLVGTSSGRPTDDWYPSPPMATESLLRVEQFEGSVLEPACGDGAICRVLEAHGYETVATDLVYRGWGEGNHDFLTSSLRSDNIITNPPYNLCDQFIELSVARTTKKVCLLTKLQILEGTKRKVLFERLPLARVWVFSKRLTMTRHGQPMKNSGMIAFCWIVFEHGYQGRPMLGWL